MPLRLDSADADFEARFQELLDGKRESSRDVNDIVAGIIELSFAGGGTVRLGVECLEARLSDLGAAWAATAMPKHALGGGRIEAIGDDRLHGIEMQRGALAYALVAPALARFPIEAVHQQREAAVAACIAHIGNAHDGVLHMGGNDFEVFSVKREKLEVGHGWSAPSIDRVGLSASRVAPFGPTLVA